MKRVGKFITNVEAADDDEQDSSDSQEAAMNEIDFDMFGEVAKDDDEEEQQQSSSSSSEEEEEESDEGEEEEEEQPQQQGGKKRRVSQEEQQEEHSSSDSSSELYETSATRASFDSLNLSRPLLKAVRDLGWTESSPIQASVIPLALQGGDICGSAVTGSGKTAAFVLPILERLLFRGRRVALTRVLILAPTRELAAQCDAVVGELSKYTDITRALCVGGLSNKTQEAALRRRPDIVIGTPGRIIDHMMNAQGFSVDEIEVLVLDEADRLLEMGFSEQIEEIVRFCPVARQTLLFSATLGSSVEGLAQMALRKPHMVKVDARLGVAEQLNQEFVRVRPSAEPHMEGMLLALLKSTFKRHVIVFVARKTVAHRLKLILELDGMRAAELHGNMTQAARLEALASFRDSKVDILVATDVAARGLDIAGVKTVINWDMPKNHETYIHRVGRTARAGRRGRSISFFKQKDRILLKEILKKSGTKKSAVQRVVPVEEVQAASERIDAMHVDLLDIAEMERAEKELRQAQQKLTKLDNLDKHRDEILSRPKREWFQTEAEKQRARIEQLKAAMPQKKGAEGADAAPEKPKKKKVKKERKPRGPSEEEIQLMNRMQQAKRRARNEKRAKPHANLGRTDDDYQIKAELPDDGRRSAASIFDSDMKRASLGVKPTEKRVKRFQKDEAKKASEGNTEAYKAKKYHKRKSFQSKRRYKRR